MKLSSRRRARPNYQMLLRLIHVLPAAALLLAFAATPLHAQDSDDGLLRRGDRRPPPPGRPMLPPIPPTAQPAPSPQATPETTPLAAAGQVSPAILNTPAPHRALVLFTSGMLEVRADNSSLLQVLHDISRITGMKINGGVTEQRIFGDYGPGSSATVLATLLDGTGANMLLQQDPVTGAPVELVLSQRPGAGNPASPNDPGFDDSPFPTEKAPAPHAALTTAPAPSKPDSPATAQKTVNTAPTGILSPAPPGLIGAPNPPPGQVRNADGTTSAATPESIYQQLMQMKQAKAAAEATAPPATEAPSATPPAPAPPATPH